MNGLDSTFGKMAQLSGWAGVVGKSFMFLGFMVKSAFDIMSAFWDLLANRDMDSLARLGQVFGFGDGPTIATAAAPRLPANTGAGAGIGPLAQTFNVTVDAPGGNPDDIINAFDTIMRNAEQARGKE